MKLDKIKFAQLIHFISSRLDSPHMDNVFIESLDEIIDIDVPVADPSRVSQESVDELLRNIAAPDGFIPAIKAYRALTGAGLKEAKEAVERYRIIHKFPKNSQEGATLGDILNNAKK